MDASERELRRRAWQNIQTNYPDLAQAIKALNAAFGRVQLTPETLRRFANAAMPITPTPKTACAPSAGSKLT